jgi:Holliday junction resolvasome RuvABC endonuclease subunit
MQLIAIDIGINNLGVALFKEGKLFNTYLFKETSKDSVEKRLYSIYSNLNNLVKKEIDAHKETTLIFEIPYFSFNSKTGKVLDYVTGIIYLFSYAKGYKIKSYTANEIKKEILGHLTTDKKTRQVNKDLVKKAVEKILELDLTHLSDHEIDAIAIGLCYLQKGKFTICK